MLPDELKKQNEEMEKLATSEYFSYLVKQQIRRKIEELLKKHKWVWCLVLVFVAIICVILGYKFWDIGVRYKAISGKFAAIETEMADFEGRMNAIYSEARLRLESFRRESEFTCDTFEKSMTSQQQFMDERQGLNREYLGMLKSQLDQAGGILGDYEKRRTLLDSLAVATKTGMAEIDGFKQSLTQKIADMDNLMGEIKTTTSIAYLFVERGDRNPADKEYRPARVRLPYSDSYITAVFHKENKYTEKRHIQELDKSIKKEIKEAHVDIIIGGEGKKSQTLSYIFKEHEPRLIAGTNYYLEAIFIYLPPNPIIVSIPDLVILKICKKGDTGSDM